MMLPTMASPTFLILDGNALLHRAWHAIPPLTTRDGRVVNAVYGFVNVVEKMLSQFKPEYMAVAWDLPGGTFRHDEYAPYKATREKKADELYAQIPMIQEVLSAYGIPSLSVPGFEADDILGTISAMNEQAGLKTLIVTGDLDSLQLVSEMTTVVFFVKGLSETKLYTPEAVKERYGLRPDQLIDLKTLLGDTSDNLPGVQGIGDKTAKALLAQFGTVKGIFDALKAGKVEAKFAKKLEGKEEVAKQMCRLVTIVRDVQIPGFDRAKTTVHAPDLDRLLPMLRDLEFKNLLKKYEGSSEEVQEQKSKVKMKKAETKRVEDVAALAKGAMSLVVETKATDLFGNSLAAVGISDGSTMCIRENPNEASLKEMIAELAHATEIHVHDYKSALHALARAGADVRAIARAKVFDTMVAAYLLSPGDREFAFADVLHLEFGVKAETSTEQLPVLFDLVQRLRSRLKTEGMDKLAEEIEMPLVGVLFGMERNGVAVDTVKLKQLSELFDAKLKELTKQIYRLAGKEFNIASPAQLALVLFEDLQLPTKGIKKTKSGYSTAAPELDKIMDEHAIVPLIGEYREAAKLKSTYADSLPELVAKDGRIHGTFNQCIAATGRLSSTNPNLQNIPIRTELGREIRKAFIAPKGSKLISADYSQIELRLAAAIAKDKAFIDAFKEHADIHRRTAAEMWGVPEAEVTKAQRSAAKAINFGILYGIGPRSLARSAGVTFDEAKDFIDRYFVAHPGIASYLQEAKLQAHDQAYAVTMYGRKRYLPDINSGVPQLVAAAERMAINMPVQGTQADIIKMAMRTIADWIRDEQPEVKMLLQVHDELVFEVPDAIAEKIGEEIRCRMRDVVVLDVPLAVDVDIHQNWGDME